MERTLHTETETVVETESETVAETDAAHPIESPRTDGRRIHPYSLGITVLIDNVMFGAGASVAIPTAGLGLVVSSMAAFGLTTLVTYLVQRNLGGQTRERSLTYACVLGTLAGVPTSLFGTAAGGALLLKAGFGRLLRGRRQEVR
ncbi:MAG: hypothetical protein AAGC60_16970 [Acidobacteriota bacterium]